MGVFRSCYGVLMEDDPWNGRERVADSSASPASTVMFTFFVSSAFLLLQTASIVIIVPMPMWGGAAHVLCIVH